MMRPTITSFSNPAVKATHQLRKSSVRRKSCQFLIDGQREIELALQHGIYIEKIFVSDQSDFDPNRIRSIGAGVEVLRTSEMVAEKLSYGDRGAIPIAVARTPERRLDEIEFSSTSFLLILDRTEKPGNLGACLRTAAACGASVILTDPICELFNPNTIRASRGTVFSVPVAITSVAEYLQRSAIAGLQTYCALVDGSTSMWDIDFTVGCGIVFGNEATGLDAAKWNSVVRKSASKSEGHKTTSTPATRDPVQSFTIPMQDGGADSLNLSISSAIALYEAMRQRT